MAKDRMEKLRQIIALFRYTLFIIGPVIFAAGYIEADWNMEIGGLMVLFLSNLFFGFAKGSTRVVFLLFHAAIFTFLLSRPFILALRGGAWYSWYEISTGVTDAQKYAPTQFALNVIFVSMIALRLGACIGDGILNRFLSRRKHKAIPDIMPQSDYSRDFIKSLQICSLIFFLITIAASFMEGADKLLFMQGKSYEDYYVSYVCSLPGVIVTLAAMAKYAMCIFLATMPKKTEAVCVMFLYLLDAVPLLIIGLRNPVILRLLFIFVYFVFRDICKDTKKWIGRFEKLMIIILSPVLIVFMGIVSYIRSASGYSGNFLDSIVNFFYDQGTSFDTLRAFYNVISDLPGGTKNYTFGPFTEYIVNGSIGQKLFGSVELGSSNSEIRAVYGSSLSHSAMYVFDKDSYLAGHGRGSSFILENYVDWGYAGVFIGSFLLGIFLIAVIVLLMQENILVRVIAFVSLLELFFMPRSEATGWISFIVYIQFWLLVVMVYFAAGLCKRKYSFKYNTSSNHLKNGKYSEYSIAAEGIRINV